MSKKGNTNNVNTLGDGGSIYKMDPSPHSYLRDEILTNVCLIPLEEVFFPFMQIGTVLTHPNIIATARKAYKDNDVAFFFLASETMPEDLRKIDLQDLYGSKGCFGKITNIEDHEDGSITITTMMEYEGEILGLVRRLPYLRGDVQIIIPDLIDPIKEEFEIEESLNRIYLEISAFLSDNDREQLNQLLGEIPDRTFRRLYFMMQNSPLSIEARYGMFLLPTLSERRMQFLELLQTEKVKMGLRSEIHAKTIAELGNRQKEEFLRMQIQQIKNELGETDASEIDELRMRASAKEWTDETMERFLKEVRKLERYNPTSPDYAIQYTYIDTFLDLPWLHCDNSDFELDTVEKILDRDHFGLDKVKERIIEQMAVLKLRGDTKAPILCLYGPPGVGKTSLGKSIADALGRKYVRVALGGLHDEAEIRGHRRTYLGSMPGRIINALIKCGTSDPVMVLDEIDKIGADYKGDPAQALLEVLDPEQNCNFHDNFIDQDYDLSNVLFIATANSLQTISPPLLDRMELIEVGGYVEMEKVEIAQRHLIPKCLLEHGFDSNEIAFENDALLEIINSYTRESGVRKLEKEINRVLRKLARKKAGNKDYVKIIDKDSVSDYLGKPLTFNDRYENNDIPGIVTGLAWTQAGGEILFIESSVSPGKEGKLTLTGNLGDVMKESAILALQYIKANYSKIGIDDKSLEFGTIHIHVPEGAVPKDGPSAGITIVTSLASTLSGRKVKERLAMTGEITLRGKVLPVGGIKEKILAAKRAGINTIILSEKNRKDIEEINNEYIKGLVFHYVDTIDEVLNYALLPKE